MNKNIILSRKTVFTLVFAWLVSLLIAISFVHQVSAKENTSDSYLHLRLFTDVLGLVQKNYFKTVAVKDLVDGAVKGMLMALDPHSGYLDQDTYKELQVETKGEFGGLGIEITIKDGMLTVVAPIEESPAARAGMRPGDQIIKIEDEFTKDLSLMEAVKKMRGPKGTPIKISVYRNGQKSLIPVTIIRDVIRVKSVRHRMLEDGFGYVRLAQFQEGSAHEFRESIKQLSKASADKRLHGLVLDMRNNPGGLLTQAIRVADIFIKDGVIVYTDGRLEGQKQKYFANDEGNEPAFPIVALVNGGSASASEIVAGALQDHKRAMILGEQTFGKGSVQTILPMDNGAALRLTTALYYTKSGRSIQAQGITPDILVPFSESKAEEDKRKISIGERDLHHAIENPTLNKPEQTKTIPPSSKEEPEDAAETLNDEDRLIIGSRAAMTAELEDLLRQDNQLDEALRLLKTWHIFQGSPSIRASKVQKEATS